MKDDNKNIIQLIIGFLTHDITDDELKQLDVWKKSTPENQAKFEQYESAWLKSKNLKVFQQIDIEKDWKCVHKQINKNKHPNNSLKRFSISVRKIAAVFIPILFIALSGLLYWNVPGFGRLSAFKSSTVIQSVTLPDGSKVTLNKYSKIIYPNNIATAASRDITLSGEAFFEVFHNKTPFKVETGDVMVQVLGTKFNIQEINSDIAVSVISGKVNVSTPHKQLKLTKGKRAICSNGLLIEEYGETENDIFWYSHQLRFKQANLIDICKELQKNFEEIKTVKINTNDLSTRVTTSFDNQNLKDILEELQIHFNKN